MPALSAPAFTLIARDIKLAHSVFAMPFAVLGAFLARDAGAGWGGFAGRLALVVVCMVSARTWAMLVNRLADRRFDADNPRTARRVFAAGMLSPRIGWLFAGGSALLFVLACAGFFLAWGNVWPLALSVPVLGWIAAYSYTKRFTALCHLWLGASLAIAPLAAALAVHPLSVGLEPGLGLHAGGVGVPAIFWLAGMVVCWVAGFDVLYALADLDFDRSRALSSLPARLGRNGALWAARALHAGAIALLAAAALSDERFGPVFAGGALLAAGLLVAEHLLIARRGNAAIPLAFFTLNGVVALALGLAGVVDVVVP